MNESSRSATFASPLVHALETRLHSIDLIGWAEITARAEALGLSFVDLRLLLALTARSGASRMRDLARLSGLSGDAAQAGINRLHARGYVQEEQRRFSLNENGRDLVATLEAAHRRGVERYVDGLDARDRQWLDEAIRASRSAGRTAAAPSGMDR